MIALEKQFGKLNGETDLVKLKLTGRLPAEVFENVGELLRSLEKHVLYLEPDTSGLLSEIRQEDIDSEFTEGSFPHRLLSELASNEADVLALQVAHQLIKDAS